MYLINLGNGLADFNGFDSNNQPIRDKISATPQLKLMNNGTSMPPPVNDSII
ncbi:MAG: hypothetical protein IPL95_12115 [Saprospiraceae bacterium]|nr:hypothetical protein [Saprospiraceae bacterium]